MAASNNLITHIFAFKSTVKFYGEPDKRHVTVLEKEKANLPLRLTGDGVSTSYHKGRIVDLMLAN